MRSLRQLAASGLSNPLHNPTPDYPFRRVIESIVGSATRT